MIIEQKCNLLIGIHLFIQSIKSSGKSLRTSITFFQIICPNRIVYSNLIGFALQFDLDGERAVLVAFVQTSMDFIVVYIQRRFGIQHHVALDTTQTPEVLTFEIGAIGEAIDLHCQCILPHFDKWREVKLRIGFGIFREAHKLPVHPNIIGRLHGTEVDEGQSIFPSFRNLKLGQIEMGVP